ncbi:MAG: dodecin family protein [Methanomassiliicoccales archaeon]|nr:dodecin family protein [Methanomassiliicoccales archaeon]
MVQKIIEILGTSEESFSRAADNAIQVAAQTVRGITAAKVIEMDCKVDNGRVKEYRAILRIFFEVER